MDIVDDCVGEQKIWHTQIQSKWKITSHVMDMAPAFVIVLRGSF